MCNLFNINQWDANADYIVFDDVPFDDTWFAQVRKPVWGGQDSFNIVGKCRAPRNVKWGKPVIFCCNEANFYRNMRNHYGQQLLPDSEQKWYDDNSVVVFLNDKLY